jgi:hypothetical protein
MVSRRQRRNESLLFYGQTRSDSWRWEGRIGLI